MIKASEISNFFSSCIDCILYLHCDCIGAKNKPKIISYGAAWILKKRTMSCGDRRPARLYSTPGRHGMKVVSIVTVSRVAGGPTETALRHLAAAQRLYTQ